jgi:hypothetical protein
MLSGSQKKTNTEYSVTNILIFVFYLRTATFFVSTDHHQAINTIFKNKVKNVIHMDLPYIMFIGSLHSLGGPDSSVGIATGYGLNGPGIESQWGRDFLHTSRPALRPAQPPVQWAPGLSRG